MEARHGNLHGIVQKGGEAEFLAVVDIERVRHASRFDHSREDLDYVAILHAAALSKKISPIQRRCVAQSMNPISPAGATVPSGRIPAIVRRMRGRRSS